MRVFILITIFTFGHPLAAGELICSNRMVTVLSDQPELAKRVCQTSDRAIALFATCGFKLSNPVRIETQSQIDPACFGLYSCDDARIAVLTPQAMATLRDKTSIFAPISTPSFFDSVVVHELAHALYDGAPCPYEQCRATSEYFAYSVQIMSLADTEREMLERALDMERLMPDDYINAILLLMSPNAFAKRVWINFRQNENQCARLGNILSGAVVFDQSHP